MASQCVGGKTRIGKLERRTRCAGASKIIQKELLSLKFIRSLSFYRRQYSTETQNEVRLSSTSSKGRYAAVPSVPRNEYLFQDSRVQAMLKKLAGRNLMKIYGNEPQKKVEASDIRLLTDQELLQIRQQKLQEGEARTQMPPVMSPREENVEIISDDPLLEAYDACRHLFTDITYGVKPRDRYIMVRETNGLLRTATWDERDRMNQIYFEMEGRELEMPAVFLDENLQEALERGFEEYLLNRVCIQFEPDDPHFIRVCGAVYDYLEKTRNYSLLESTRHMGGLLFHLIRNQKVDNYLIYLLRQGRLDDCVDVLRLDQLINERKLGTGKSLDEMDSVEALKQYITGTSQEKGYLELALQSYQELIREQHQSRSALDQGSQTPRRQMMSS